MIEAHIPAQPNTLNMGDYVTVANANVTHRKLLIDAKDTVNVTSQILVSGAERVSYELNNRIYVLGASGPTGAGGTAQFSITDQSSGVSGGTGVYNRASGFVWRWTCDNNVFAANASIGRAGATIGNMLYTSMSGTGSTGNSARAYDDVPGFPIVAVDPNGYWVDVINPDGVAINALTTLPSNSFVSVVPSLAIKWQLAHTVGSRYRVEKIGYNDLFRIRYVVGSGVSPDFVNCGVAVDDTVTIGGTTGHSFNLANTGTFTIQAVTPDYIVVQNPDGVEELDSVRLVLNTTWRADTNTVTLNGATGAVSVGDWVKKQEDDDGKYTQVIAISGDGKTLTLGSPYSGISADGLTLVAYDEVNGVNAGVTLNDRNDIVCLNADSVMVGDTLYIDDIAGTFGWFSSVNAGTFDILGVSFDVVTGCPCLQTVNSNFVAESDIMLSVELGGFLVNEGDDNRTACVKTVEYTAISELNPDLRYVYLSSPRLSYKFTRSNGAKLTAMGKLGYDVGVTEGIDGYKYYTGLLQKAQRTIDGYEPDTTTYPGCRAIGGIIELLPPLIKRIQVALLVSTNLGVNLNDIDSDIRSAVIRYVNGLGVGEDVILSEIIAALMGIRGVAAVTFLTPAPDLERITIDSISKAFIELADISLS